MKRMKRFLAAVLACLMCFGVMSVPALADEIPADGGRGLFTIDKTATPLDENDYTDVTLEVPGDVEGYIDVVFILGGGMAVNREAIESAINVFMPAMESGKTTVRMGLISLEYGQEIILDLNSEEAVLDPDTFEQLIEDKFDYMSQLYPGTTNLHSQLLIAEEMLEKETKAEASNKYIFVMATGRTYWFDDADGNEAMILSESETEGKFAWGNFVWQQQRAVGTSFYQIPRKYNNSYEAYFADIEKWVAADGDKYVYAPPIDKADTTSAYYWQINNQKQTCPINATSNTKRMGLLIEAPAPDATLYDGITFKYNSQGGPDHALNYERAHYECVQVWKRLVAANYNCYSICSEQYRYQNYSSKIGGKDIQLGHAFMDYLSELAGNGKATVVFEDDGTNNGKAKEDFFAPVREDLLYNCSIGSTVEDYIGYDAEKGNFEFVQDPATMTLTAGGKTYTTNQIETKEGATASYEFTAPEAAEATFWLDYYYGDGMTTEKFVWTFGENLSLANRASLTYKLKLTEKTTEEGTHTVDTNIEATLYPKDSDGNDGEPQKFPVPNVEYVVSIERTLNFFKSTVINDVAYALEGITFDIYYAATVDEYTAFVDDYAVNNAAEIAALKAELIAKYVEEEKEESEITALIDAEIAKMIQDAFEAAKAPEANDTNLVVTVVTGADGKAVCDVPADGIYLVIEREHPAIVEPLAPFAVAVPMTSEDGSELVRVVNINPKNDILPGPEVIKNVTSIDNDLDSFDIGQTHTWILRGGMPVDVAIGKSYVMTDVMSESLTYVGNVKVVVDDTDAQAGTETVTLVAGEDYTVSEVVDNTFSVSLTASGMAKADEALKANDVDANEDNVVDYKDMEIRVYFDAQINANAEVAAEIPNTVTLEYKNSVGIIFTDSDDADVFTCGVHIYKYDAKDAAKPLANAVFKLAEEVAEGTEGATTLVVKDENGRSKNINVVYKMFYDVANYTAETAKVDFITTDEYGNAVICGLEEGEYYLVETKAPAGYNLLSYPVKITLNQGSYMNMDILGTEANEDMTVRVANSNTFQLPATGGIGTTIFTVAGALLMGTAGVILVNKKKDEE